MHATHLMAFPWPTALFACLALAVATAELIDRSRLPLHTSGRYIVDVEGRRVRLNCANWYGAHMKMMVMNGMELQPLANISKTIVGLGLNCIRLPYSMDMIYGNYTHVPDAKVSLAANPELQDSSPLEVFDATLASLTDAGLIVILNNHVSSSTWCCSLLDGEGMWYTEQYSEADWLVHLVFMTKRYRENLLVAGFDMRNELRSSELGNPTWGYGERSKDWSIAAEKGGKLVLAENPGMLVIVSGLWYSIFLCAVPNNPIHLHDELKGHIVYTSHEYAWVNFHLTARHWIGVYLWTLAIWCCFLCLVVVLSWFLEYRGQLRPGWFAQCSSSLLSCRCRSRAASGRCYSRTWRCVADAVLGPGVAFLLTLFSVLAFLLAPRYVGRCTMMDWVVGLSLTSFAFGTSAVSLFLWMRIALGACSSDSGSTECEGSDASAREISMREMASPVERGVAMFAGAVSPGQGRPFVPEAGGGSGGKQALCMRALVSKRLCALVVSLVALILLLSLHHRFGEYDVFVAEVDERWGFMLSWGDDGGVPVWLGEFGTSSDSLYWRHTMRYLREHDVDWSYWSLNGEMRPGHEESFGLLNPDMVTVQQPWKMHDIQELINR
mmetsp:Transcript_48003/g.124878  ORF Transcript_48003/g.124878 Transcript_48003/m.124878 type:complete len:608 (+) Transcript_48003:35-1858(+)